ncbi:DNA helicase mcm9 [Dissophora globulifera]|nr:DNA helicase mcm9 [Dissophora globulifera]
MAPSESESDDYFRAPLKAAVLELHRDKIYDILLAPDTTQHYSVVIDIAFLVDYSSDSRLCTELTGSPHTVLPIFDSILQDVQLELINTNDNPERHLSLKPKCTARLMGLPAAEFQRMTIPNSSDIGKFLSITATVVRTGVVKMLENSKKFFCAVCKQTFEVQADVEQFNQVITPTRCLAKTNARPCQGNRFQMVETPPGQLPDGCRDYQEIKIQEQTNKLTMGTIPGSMVVILHDDLVDHAKSGDDVKITGTVIRRWKSTIPGERCDIELALLANHVFIYNEQRIGVGLTEEQRLQFEQFWSQARSPAIDKPYTARNQILAQICPKVYGLYLVKLAVMLVLTGGVQKVDKSGLKVRGEPHLLLVGDPGTGKSQFLKYAAELNPRSVLTTGIGSSSAGLTVTAVKDGNEWQLEAGALVLADRGLCCIDEFGGMREHDKTAIHEAMEQQSISIAKAGIVCKLNTRCSVIAATNPKGKYDPLQSVSVNIALASPLLSRFDIVLVLMDTGNVNWDRKISSYILDTRIRMDDDMIQKTSLSRREIVRRRKRLRRLRKQRELEHSGMDPATAEAAVASLEREDPQFGGDDEEEEEEEGEEDESQASRQQQESWSLDKLKAYLIWIKSTFEPKLTPPAEQVLVSYYQLQRKADLRNAARTTIRLLESLIRLSQAHARLMARNEVTVEDAVVVVQLIENTAQGGAAMLGGINPLYASFPKNAEEEYGQQEITLLKRLGLLHLASRRRVEVDETPEPEVEGYNNDDGVNDNNSNDVSDHTSGARSKRRRRLEEDDADVGPSGSMVLDDRAATELMARFGYEANVAERYAEVKEEREEPLIDRRTTRRKVNSSAKRKGVASDIEDEGDDDVGEEDSTDWRRRQTGEGSREM